MTPFLVCLSAWLVMSFAVARAEYRRTRAKVLDTIREEDGRTEVARIRTQAHQDGVHNARVMFFMWPLAVPVMMIAELVKMIVVGRPLKVVAERNWETAQQLRDTERTIERLEDERRHADLTAEDPARPHPDCGVCRTRSYPMPSLADVYPSIFTHLGTRYDAP